MTHNAQPTTPHLRPLVISLLTGPVVWSVYHMVSYFIIEAACRTPLLSGQVAGLPTVSLIVLGLALVGVVLIAIAGFASYLRYRRQERTEGPNRAETAAQFLTLSAILLSALFALLVVLAGLPALFLTPCVTQ